MVGRTLESNFNSKSAVEISGSSSLASFLALEFKKVKSKPIPLTLAQKWSKLLFNEEFADINIRVGTDSKTKHEYDDHVVFPCHKLVLATNSPFFWNLFRTTKDLSVIRFIEFSPDSIRIFLKFLYTEELESKLWESHEILLHILELSHKFQVPSLKQTCIENFSKLNLTRDNVLCIWVRAREYQEIELENFTIKYICLNADKIMNGKILPENFLNLHRQDLKSLIGRDDLQIEENILFNAVLQWAQHKCQLLNEPMTGQSLRKVLRDVIYFIRFPLMSTSHFTNVIIPQGLLSADEISKILRLIYLPSQYESDMDSPHRLGHENKNENLNNKDNHYYPFNKKPRLKQGPIFSVCRFGSVKLSQEEKYFGDKFYSLRFLTSKSIALVGFGFYGAGEKTLNGLKFGDKLIFDVEVHLRKFDGSLFTFAVAHKSIVVTKEKWDKCKNCHKQLVVEFDFPVTLQSNSWYHCQYKINGSPTMTGDENTRKMKTTVVCKDYGDITFQFPDLNDDNQLPILIFKFFE